MTTPKAIWKKKIDGIWKTGTREELGMKEKTIIYTKYAEDGQSRAIVYDDNTSRFQILVGNFEDQEFETQYEFSPAEADFTTEAHRDALEMQGKPRTGLIFTPGWVIRPT